MAAPCREIPGPCPGIFLSCDDDLSRLGTGCPVLGIPAISRYLSLSSLRTLSARSAMFFWRGAGRAKGIRRCASSHYKFNLSIFLKWHRFDLYQTGGRREALPEPFIGPDKPSADFCGDSVSKKRGSRMAASFVPDERRFTVARYRRYARGHCSWPDRARGATPL